MSEKDDQYMYEINRLEGERDGLRDLTERLRADQQEMHTLIGDLCKLFPDKSPQAILGEVRQLQAANARLEKMLELAARRIIVAVPLDQYDGSLWRARYDVAGMFWEFVYAGSRTTQATKPRRKYLAVFECRMV